MIRLSVFILFFSFLAFCDELPIVQFSCKNFPQVSEWQEYIGDTAYASYDSDAQVDMAIYNSEPVFPEKALIPLYNDGRGEGFLGNFASHCSVNNTRLLEMLLAKGYHLDAYSWKANKKNGEVYTIIGYERDREQFIIRFEDGKEKHIAYDEVKHIQFIDVKTQNNVRHWYITSICELGQSIKAYESELETSSLADAIHEVINRNFPSQNIENIKFFVQLIDEGDFPIHVAGWSGETQFDQMVNFSGSKYNALGEQVVTIYISDQGATGCHVTRYTIGAKGDGYSDNIVSGEVYCQSTNPVAINKAAGMAQFLLRCKVRKNSPTPWWAKANIFYRLFTPNNK